MQWKWGARPVPVAPVGVPPTGYRLCIMSLNGGTFEVGQVFGETPNTATGTGRAPHFRCMITT